MNLSALDKVRDGALAIGDDGYAYLLSSDGISVVSESGELVPRLLFHKPDTHTSAVRVDGSEGLVLITLENVDADHAVATTY